MTVISKHTGTLAGKGNERCNYDVVEGEEVEGMDGTTLAHYLNAGLLERSEPKKRKPSNKSGAGKKTATKKKAAKKKS